MVPSSRDGAHIKDQHLLLVKVVRIGVDLIFFPHNHYHEDMTAKEEDTEVTMLTWLVSMVIGLKLQ